ncbi:heterokaryon incompatibility protein-domain-containing protein [Lophiotrema nucula]|uniref:Heterokaryon incompatibility protein-domain-containing protein n=1 Tax=Lophiotrema nucula TaxID=690887 RepID=A0A6A5YEP4_9PLEO|nr:heterokaryon incompatibility protein-domain-containing protein [Lophiotrema nucula]
MPALRTMEPHSCVHCQDCVIDISDQPRFPDNGFVSYTLTDVETRRDAGCPLFQFIITAFHDDDWIWAQCRAGVGFRCVAWCSVENGERSIGFSVVDARGKIVLRHPTKVLVLTADEANPAAQWVPTRPINLTRGTSKSYQLAKSWLSECLNSHHHHHELPSEMPMPSRLLNISRTNDTYEVRVMKPTASVPFVALSYCWGGDQPHKSIKANLKLGERIMACGDLPTTIQDAVSVTFNVGYNYLWVDSLCIVQDDDDDKSREIARMPEIYSNSAFTIAATGSTAATEGFLNLTRTDSKEVTLKLTLQCPDGQNGVVIAHWDRHMLDPDDAEALDTRAWAFQERLLSIKILEFKSHQMKFVCPSSGGKRWQDGWRDPWESHTGTNDLISSLARGQGEPRRVWWDVIERYTRRNLTIPSDRILAISGIANRIGTYLNDRYLAGHWQSTLPDDLLWYTPPESPPSFIRRTPSWSWTSVDGTILRFHPRASPDHVKAELLHHTLELRDGNAPYGTIQAASLTIKGRLKAAWCTMIEGEYGNVNPGGQDSSLYKSDLDPLAFNYPAQARKWVVTLLEINAGENFVLPTRAPQDLYTRVQKPQWITFGLVLKEETLSDDMEGHVIEGHRRFSRLGIFSFNWLPDPGRSPVYDPFRDCDTEIIELI